MELFTKKKYSLSHFLLKYLFIFFLSFIPSFAATQYVGCASLSPNNTTIQDAINAASDGDTVSICDGTYAENNIQITKNNLIIQGYSGNRANVIVGKSSSSIFSIQAANATLKNLTINSTSNNAYGITDNNQASGNHTFENLAIATKDNSIYLKNNSSAATFKNLSITSSSGSGIYTDLNSDGAHSFSDISISAKNYGIYAVRGAGSFLNMTINSGDNAIYMGSKYPATFDTIALTSTGAKGISIQNNTTALNSYTISNATINAKLIGIDIAISGKNTIRDSNITSTNDKGINLPRNADGAHELSNLDIDSRDIGIYAQKGIGSLNNITLSSSNNDGISIGDKYPIAASHINVTQSAGKAFSINNITGTSSTHTFNDINLTSTMEAFYVAKSGKLTIDGINATSASSDGISLALDAQGAHEISNITVSAQNGSGIKAMHGLGLLTDFNITAKNYGVQAPSYEDLSIQRGYITTTNDKAIYVGNGDYKTLLVEDVVISAGNHAIQLDKSSSATINRVCVDNAVIGVRTEGDARDVTITNSNFDGNSDTGVQIASDPSYPATVTNSCFLETDFASRNNDAHTFNGNYWDGTPPSGYDNLPLASCPNSCGEDSSDVTIVNSLPFCDTFDPSLDIEQSSPINKTYDFSAIGNNSDLNMSFAYTTGGSGVWDESGGNIDYFIVSSNASEVFRESRADGDYNDSVMVTSDSSAEVDLDFSIDVSSPSNEVAWLNQICFFQSNNLPIPIVDYRFDAWDTPLGEITNRRLVSRVSGRSRDILLWSVAEDGLSYQNFSGTLCARIINNSENAPYNSWSRFEINNANTVIYPFSPNFTSREARVEMIWKKDDSSVTCTDLEADVDRGHGYSSDVFSIRPSGFTWSPSISTTLKASQPTQVLAISSIEAQNGNLYDGSASIEIAGDATIQPRPNCALTSITPTLSFNPEYATFSNGSQNNTLDMNLTMEDVGVWDMDLRVVDDSWTQSDRSSGDCESGSSSNNFINGRYGCNVERIVSVQATVEPYDLNITNVSITPTGDFRYIDSNLTQNMTITFDAHVLKYDGALAQNFDLQCYQSPVQMDDINFVISSDAPQQNVIYTFNGSLASSSSYNLTPNAPLYDFTLGASQNNQFVYNFERSVSSPVNPLHVESFSSSFSSGFASASLNQDTNTTFVYGRIRPLDTITVTNSVQTPVEIEVFNSGNSNFTDGMFEQSINWYRNKSHNGSIFGQIFSGVASLPDGSLPNASADVSVATGAINDGIQELTLTTSEPAPISRTIHLDISPWLWYSTQNRAYDASVGSTCKDHPCLNFQYDDFTNRNAIESGDFGGLDFNASDLNEDSGGARKRGIKVFR